VIAPHPDDETLGCGGTLLKMKHLGHRINWMIATQIPPPDKNTRELEELRVAIENREKEIGQVNEIYGFDSVIKMKIPTTTIDEISFRELVSRMSLVIKEIEPSIVFVPYINDVHTDHCFIAKAMLSCCKWFRYRSIKYILFYETISETDFNINPADRKINLNIYVDISEFWEKKIQALQIYASELGNFPFPRSIKAIESLANLRGSQCGAEKAEAFELLRGIIF
jgi:LmbE family N-acetylglucosaminyl deacetylase